MNPLEILGLVIGGLVAFNVLLCCWLLLSGRERKLRPVSREEIAEVREDWSWPR